LNLLDESMYKAEKPSINLPPEDIERYDYETCLESAKEFNMKKKT